MEQTLIQPAGRELVAYPTIAESWAAMGWYALFTLVLIVVVLVPAKLVGTPLGLTELVLMLGLTIAANGLLVLWLRYRAGASRWLRLRWQVPRRPLVAFGLLLLVVPSLAVVLSAQWFLHLPHWSAGKTLARLMVHPWLALVFGSLLAPLAEEVVFRGVLLPGLLRNYRPAVAIGQSALLFGLVHLNPAQALNAFFMGLLLGWLYYRSRSLWLCVGLHGCYNALALTGNRLPALANKNELPALMHQPAYLALWLIAALVLAASVLALVRSQKAVSP